MVVENGVKVQHFPVYVLGGLGVLWGETAAYAFCISFVALRMSLRSSLPSSQSLRSMLPAAWEDLLFQTDSPLHCISSLSLSLSLSLTLFLSRHSSRVCHCQHFIQYYIYKYIELSTVVIRHSHRSHHSTIKPQQATRKDRRRGKEIENAHWAYMTVTSLFRGKPFFYSLQTLNP